MILAWRFDAFFDRYILLAYRARGCIFRPAKILEIAAIQDGHQNIDLYRTEWYLS